MKNGFLRLVAAVLFLLSSLLALSPSRADILVGDFAGFIQRYDETTGAY